MSPFRAEPLILGALLALLLPAPAGAAVPPEALAALARGDATAARALLEARLASAPEDGEVIVRLARLELEAGETNAAHRRLAAHLGRVPRDAEAWLALGQVLLKGGRLAEAATCFAAAGRLTEEPVARQLAREGEIAALSAAGPSPELESRLAIAERTDTLTVPPGLQRAPLPAVAEAPAPAGAPTPARWELRPLAVADSLSNTGAPWLQLGLAGAYAPMPRARLGAFAALIQRFGQSAPQAGLDASWPLTERLTGFGDLALAPGAVVVPAAAAGAGLHAALPGGWGLEASGRYSAYANGGVPFAALALEKYLGAWRLAYSLGVSPSADWAWPLRHLASASYYLPDDRSAVTLRAAAGTEVEQVSATNLLRTDVLALALDLRWWLGERFALVPQVGFTRQGALYDRLTAGLGAVVAF